MKNDVNIVVFIMTKEEFHKEMTRHTVDFVMVFFLVCCIVRVTLPERRFQNVLLIEKMLCCCLDEQRSTVLY